MIANTKKQPLHQHLFSVGYLAKLITEKLTNDKKIINSAFVSGIFHDIGKVDTYYQQWACSNKESDELENGSHINDKKVDGKNFSFKNHPRHNEISLMIFQLIIGSNLPDTKDFLFKNGVTGNARTYKDIIDNAIYWHHSKPYRDVDYKSIGDILSKSVVGQLDYIIDSSLSILTEVNKIASNYDCQLHYRASPVDNALELADYMRNNLIPSFKSYDTGYTEIEDFPRHANTEAITNIVRSSVVIADRIISSLTAKELEEVIEKNQFESLLPNEKKTNLNAALNSHSACFYPGENRTKLQIDCALELRHAHSIPVLCGAAGSGKTKIACEWAKMSIADTLFWVVPRVSVGLSIYEELTSNEYLSSVNVQIYTGEKKSVKKHGLENDTEQLIGDVIITTIDQLVNAVSSNNNIQLLQKYLSSHCVFDEYHEYVTMPGFDIFFIELVKMKKVKDKYQCLLVSATPNYLYLEKMFDISANDVVRMRSFNESDYTIDFEHFTDKTPIDEHPLTRHVQDGTFVISNNVDTAQLGFIKNDIEKAILIHSQFIPTEKALLIDRILRVFGKNQKGDFKILRAAPIIQASFNITCDAMISEASTPENILQRLGRLDRFGLRNLVNTFTIAIPESISTNKPRRDRSGMILNNSYSFKSSYQWYKYLNEHCNGTTLKINDLYDMYEDFYSNPEISRILEDELFLSLTSSMKLIKEKVFDPLWIKKSTSKRKTKLKANSLRGNSYYVQMATCKLHEGRVLYNDEYCEQDIPLMTTSAKDIFKSIDFFQKKHHQISDFKGAKNFSKLDRGVALKYAREPETPIYISYTPKHLNEVNAAADEGSYYYLTSDRQPIGKVSYDFIKNFQSK